MRVLTATLQLLFVIAILSLVACGNMGTGADGAVNIQSQEDSAMSGVSKLSAAEIAELEDSFVPMTNLTGSNTSFSAAIYGAVHEMRTFGSVSSLIKKIYVPTRFLSKGPLMVQVFKSKKAKAPLAVLVNPLFSGELAGQMNRYADFFMKKDYNVMVLMNPFSPEITDQGPTFFPGDTEVEATMYLEMIETVITTYFGKNNIDGVTMAGVSYGAFMSAVIKAFDEKRVVPLIDGPTLSLSPPLDMYKSLKNIDGQTADITLGDQAMCLVGGGFLNLINQSNSVDDFSKTSMDEKCAKYFLVSLGFNAAFATTLASLNTSKNLNLSVIDLVSTNFEDYMLNIAKFKLKVGQNDLGYWLNESKKKGYNKFVIVASQDDSININVNPNQSPYYDYEGSLIWLGSGGHIGFSGAKSNDKTCGVDWADCLLNYVYTK